MGLHPQVFYVGKRSRAASVTVFLLETWQHLSLNSLTVLASAATMRNGSESTRRALISPHCVSAAPTEMTSPIAKLSFWGVRGSTPTVDPATWRFGGNTPCLDLIAPDGTQIILDCGTGLRTLGSRWGTADPARLRVTHVFVTHYHWDHIQGLPFFSPLYGKNSRSE